jgi:hypothetical protein
MRSASGSACSTRLIDRQWMQGEGARSRCSHVHIDGSSQEDAHIDAGQDPRQTAVECMSVRASIANLRTFPYIRRAAWPTGGCRCTGRGSTSRRGMLWIHDEEKQRFAPAIGTGGIAAYGKD